MQLKHQIVVVNVITGIEVLQTSFDTHVQRQKELVSFALTLCPSVIEPGISICCKCKTCKHCGCLFIVDSKTNPRISFCQRPGSELSTLWHHLINFLLVGSYKKSTTCNFISNCKLTLLQQMFPLEWIQESVSVRTIGATNVDSSFLLIASLKMGPSKHK